VLGIVLQGAQTVAQFADVGDAGEVAGGDCVLCFDPSGDLGCAVIFEPAIGVRHGDAVVAVHMVGGTGGGIGQRLSGEVQDGEGQKRERLGRHRWNIAQPAASV